MQRRKPALGQNFLTDDAAALRTLNALGDVSQRLVIEIGPGRGALTALLARRAAAVVAIELDRALTPFLEVQFERLANVKVLQANVLATDLSALARAHAVNGNKPRLLGNLPYYITSDILLHWIHHAAAFDLGVIMVQREVAQRIAASPGSRDYGLLSATVQAAFRVEELFTLPPQSFTPSPAVYSTVLRLVVDPRYAELQVEREPLEQFLKKIFAQKRKTLRSNLRHAGFGSSAIDIALHAAQLDPNIRGEACSLEQTAQLYRALKAG